MSTTKPKFGNQREPEFDEQDPSRLASSDPGVGLLQTLKQYFLNEGPSLLPILQAYYKIRPVSYAFHIGSTPITIKLGTIIRAILYYFCLIVEILIALVVRTIQLFILCVLVYVFLRAVDVDKQIIMLFNHFFH